MRSNFNERIEKLDKIYLPESTYKNEIKEYSKVRDL